MQFLHKIKLIQGGMGVYVSNWRLARAVAMEQPGTTAGTVSGTALDIVYVRLLQLGDPGGHVRRALAAFDALFGVTIGQKIIKHYFIDGGKQPGDRFKNAPKHMARLPDGSDILPAPLQPAVPVALIMEPETVELLIASGFAEVWLARQGHSGKIFINFLHKVELPLIYTMYGAMLAGVDGVIVGAGNPEGLPSICSSLAQHNAVTSEISVLYRESGENFHLAFDPSQVAEGRLAKNPLPRPAFLAIVSLENLVQASPTVKRKPRMGSSSSTIPPEAITLVPRGRLKKMIKASPSTARKTSLTCRPSARWVCLSGWLEAMAVAKNWPRLLLPEPPVSRWARFLPWPKNPA
jgi:hypothetical protein